MIVISTYNPDTPRSTTDESLLTSLLASLIRYRNTNSNLALWATDENTKAHYLQEIVNADRIMGLVYPLLGLTLTEVLELIEKDR